DIEATLSCFDPMLIPTPVNAGELPRTLDRRNRAFQVGSCTSLNVPERRAAGSTTAGRRCDSCPTYPEIPEFMTIAGLWLQPNVCALTPIGPSFDTTRSNTADL